MGKYVPTAISYQKEGLVKDRDAFVLADDAYQDLENIYQWRGRLRRRVGYDLLGRLRRIFEGVAYLTSGSSPWSFNLLTISGYISAINIGGAPTVVITTPFAHGLSNGDEVAISGVVGTTELNGNTYTIANVTATTFEVTQAGPSAYTSGGFWYSDRSLSTQEPDASLECGSFEMTIDGETITDNGDGTLTGDASATGTINYATGAITITGATASVATTLTIGYFPGLPVMGLPQRNLDAINAEQTVAFDTRYAYKFNNTSNKFDELSPPTIWTGVDSDFFWSVNYWQTSDNAQYFWTTNFSGTSGDPIRIYDGTLWHDLAPVVDSTNSFFQCRIILPYKGRMVALNTFEGSTGSGLSGALQYPQRARWSQNGAPFTSVAAGTAPTAANEWLSDVKGRGGYVDCPTNEHIISAEYIRDTLVVGFERSTWVLRYTGNEILPFQWERINRELGSESTFSMVAFDQGVLSVGDKSINSCNGNSVERIDENIPDEVFQIHNRGSDGPLRVHGIRDFYERLVYWTFPDASTSATYPDRLLVFNYHNKTWAIFTDGFTAFGEYQRFNDITWADLTETTWEAANFSWVTAKLQSQFPNIIAGNQQGFVEVLFQKESNDESLFIKDVTAGTPVSLEVPNHGLTSDTGSDSIPTVYIKIKDIVGEGSSELNDRIFAVDVTDADNITLQTKPRTTITAITQAAQAVVTASGHTFQVGQHWYIDQVTGMTEINGRNGLVVAVSGNSVTLDIDSTGFTAYSSAGAIQNLDANLVPQTVAAGTYSGCGVIERIMGFKAKSKNFNFIQGGKKTFLGHIDFLAQKTSNGEITADIYVDYNDTEPVNQVADAFFNKVFSTQEEQFSITNKNKEWHRFFCPTDAQFFNFELKLDERQLFTPSIANSDVLIDALIIWAESGGRLVD
jgi:hypothetical protein